MNNPQINDTRLTDLLSEVREYGRESASGKDALPKLAHRVVRAANEGIISLDKDSDGVDDAKRLYDEYTKSESKKAVHEIGGQRANASKLRQFIKMGMMTTVDPVNVMNRAHQARKDMIDAEQKVRPAYASLIEVARAQTADGRGDDELTDDELKGCISRPESEKTLETELGSILKRIEKLVTGDAGIKDQDERTVQAHNLIRERLAALMHTQKIEDLHKQALALGMNVTPAQVEQAVEAVRQAA